MTQFKHTTSGFEHAYDSAIRMLNRAYGGKLPDENTVCVVTANKTTSRSPVTWCGFHFAQKKKQPAVNQILKNTDGSVQKVLFIIG